MQLGSLHNMLGSRRAVCRLQKGISIPRQVRFNQTLASKEQEPIIISKGESPDPQLGSYPQLVGTSNQSKEPKGWWDNQYRRNYNQEVSCRNAFGVSMFDN